jgi:hypothetical protein
MVLRCTLHWVGEGAESSVGILESLILQRGHMWWRELRHPIHCGRLNKQSGTNDTLDADTVVISAAMRLEKCEGGQQAPGVDGNESKGLRVTETVEGMRVLTNMSKGSGTSDWS